MSMLIISGRNGGYPFIEEVPQSTFEPPFPASIMTLTDGYPTIKSIASAEFASPYPRYVQRVDNQYNDGYPCVPAIPETKYINLYIEPSKPLVHIYDSREIDFSHNGYAVLQPVSCTIRSEKNGMYEASLETIITEHKSVYLKEEAILKLPERYHGEIRYQLFRIYYVDSQMSSDGSERLVVKARHIFYDNNNKFLTNYIGKSENGNDAINHIYSCVYGATEMYDVDFSYYTDITKISTTEFEDGTSITAALIGADSAFINRWGGCLYRDNNYFSICHDTENSRSTGVIRYAGNMKSIKFSVDTSDCITFLVAVDNFGNRTTRVNREVPSARFPHHKYKYVKFNYNRNNPEVFESDVDAYFENHKDGIVNIKVEYVKLVDENLNTDFLQFDNYEVGDKTAILHKRLGINYGNLEIIAKEYDSVNDKPIRIEIGSFKNSTTRTPQLITTTSIGDSATYKQILAIKNEIAKINLKAFATWDAASVSIWDEIAQFTWEEVANIGN